LIIRVPPTCSLQKARDIEAELTGRLKKNCIVVTRNIEFCRVESVDPKELAHLLKAVDRHDPTDAESARLTSLGSSLATAIASAKELGAGDD
jgi:hypothetical protein